MSSSKTIAKQVKVAREAQGLSLRQLAKLTGMNENTLVGIEHGRGNPTLKTLESLSKALGIRFAIGTPETSAEVAERVRVALTMIRENTDHLDNLLQLC